MYAKWKLPFFKHTNHNLIIIALFVDDLIIAGTTADVNEVKHFVNSRYVIKDLGQVYHILGCEVVRDVINNTLFLTQRRYILSTVKRFLHTSDLHKVGLNASPMEASIPLRIADTDETSDSQAQMKSIPYREAIGSLLWLVAGTRAGIAFTVQTCAKFSCKPNIKHWKAVHRIFQYLHRTIYYGLTFRPSPYGLPDQKIFKSCTSPTFTLGNHPDMTAEGFRFRLGTWSDTRRSVSGYLMFLNGSLISWGSRCQQSVALS